MALALAHDRPLAPMTTLGLGGSARCFVEARAREDIVEALVHAEAQRLPVRVLGGGSNLIVADEGFAGLVVRMATRGVTVARHHDHALVSAEAGESWDALVERAIAEDLRGVECLTGIPGLVGATPIQNVGAYGQEVAEVIDAVEVLDRDRLQTVWLSAQACGFGYRDSRFKREPEAFVVLSVRFKLATVGAPELRYPELARALAARGATPSLREVQRTVRALRAHKGMLIEAGWEPSAGSFFTNPIVTADQAEQVVARALAAGVISEARALPRFAAGGDRVKLSAGWLIEHVGVTKGLARGAVGVSGKHALALVHRGGGTTSDLMALAAWIQQQVIRVFGVALAIEPVRW
jgi:UDP-N-acetylmuramate dehydrogenase